MQKDWGPMIWLPFILYANAAYDIKILLLGFLAVEAITFIYEINLHFI